MTSDTNNLPSLLLTIPLCGSYHHFRPTCSNICGIFCQRITNPWSTHFHTVLEIKNMKQCLEQHLHRKVSAACRASQNDYQYSTIMKRNLSVDESMFVGYVDFQVVGVKDERLGEHVCACIRLREGQDCTAEEIKAYCKGQVGYSLHLNCVQKVLA